MVTDNHKPRRTSGMGFKLARWKERSNPRTRQEIRDFLARLETYRTTGEGLPRDVPDALSIRDDFNPVLHLVRKGPNGWKVSGARKLHTEPFPIADLSKAGVPKKATVIVAGAGRVFLMKPIDDLGPRTREELFGSVLKQSLDTLGTSPPPRDMKPTHGSVLVLRNDSDSRLKPEYRAIHD